MITQPLHSPVHWLPITLKIVTSTGLPAALDIAGLIAAGATISDACTPLDQLTVQFSDAAPTGTCPITITRTYTITDICLNVSAALTQTITIDDNTAPTFTGTLAAITLKIVTSTGLPAALDIAGLIAAGATISDACTPLDQLTVQFSDAAPTGTCPITITRTYTITDICLNVSAALTQTITIDDNTAPTFTGTLAGYQR